MRCVLLLRDHHTRSGGLKMLTCEQRKKCLMRRQLDRQLTKRL
jgi:hypothetical protein